jgi:hypothetical protein
MCDCFRLSPRRVLHFEHQDIHSIPNCLMLIGELFTMEDTWKLLGSYLEEGCGGHFLLCFKI